MEEEVKFLFNNIEYKINKKYKDDIDNFINEYFIGLNKYWVSPLNIFDNIINMKRYDLSFNNIIKNTDIIKNFLKNYNTEYKIFNYSIYYLIASIKKYFDDRKMKYDYGCKLSCYNKKNLQKEKEDVYIEYIKQNKQFDYEDNYKNNICFFNIVIKLLEDLKIMFYIKEEEYYIFKKIILIYLYITIRLILINTSFTYKPDFYNMINKIKDFIFNNYNIKILLLKNNKEFIQKNYCLSVKSLSDPIAEVCNILNRGLTVNIYEDKIYFYNNTEYGYINYQSQELLQGGHNYKEKYLKYKLKYLNLKKNKIINI